MWIISLPMLSTMFISKGLPEPQQFLVQQSLSSRAKNTSWPSVLNTRYLLADSQPVNISSISICHWSNVRFKASDWSSIHLLLDQEVIHHSQVLQAGGAHITL